MKDDITIIGGEGFVGSGIAHVATERGLQPAIVTRDSYDSSTTRSQNVLVNANGNSKKYLASKTPELDYELSVRSVERSLEDFNPDLYIYLSSVDVYDHLTSPVGNEESVEIDTSKVSTYGKHKLMAENLVKERAPRWLIIRMAGFVGPGLWKNPIYDILKSRPLHVHPDSEFQYMHTHDFGRIVFDLVDKGLDTETFNIAGTGVVDLHSVCSCIQCFR